MISMWYAGFSGVHGLPENDGQYHSSWNPSLIISNVFDKKQGRLIGQKTPWRMHMLECMCIIFIPYDCGVGYARCSATYTYLMLKQFTHKT
jgi:hypothetical protein